MAVVAQEEHSDPLTRAGPMHSGGGGSFLIRGHFEGSPASDPREVSIVVRVLIARFHSTDTSCFNVFSFFCGLPHLCLPYYLGMADLVGRFFVLRGLSVSSIPISRVRRPENSAMVSRGSRRCPPTG